jgi:hypothetical protein
MHISLDSALGQQRRLNQVGESITQIAPDPAAAYSLRSLTGGDPKVVRVRRASDNHEQDFTASDVSSGALQDFVNAQVVAPLDIQALSATGRDGDFLIAKAAYSLRSLGTRQATLAATGDTVARADGKYVCQVRRDSDDALKSFTATEVTDGTLLAFTNADYAKYTSDFSAGDDSWGAFDDVTETGNIDGIGGLDDNLRLAIGSATSQHRAFRSNILPENQKINFSARVFIPSTNSAVDGILIRDAVNNEIISTTAPAQDQWVTVTASNVTVTNAQLRVNLMDGATTSFAGNGSDVVYLREVTVTQVTSDGFVKTWYDQSVSDQAGTATGNHATQSTASKQPKIVSAGSLLNELDFDGTEDMALATGSFSLTQAYTTFSVSHTDDASTSQGVWSTASSITGAFNAVSLFRNDDGFAVNSGTTITTAGTIDYVADRTYLQTNVVNGASSSIFVDGATGVTGNAGSNNPSGILILGFYRVSSANANLDGGIKELIIYDSDQTDNRTAIEANIGEAYSIDLPSGVDPGFDQVDGFVETWYDQSGNGKDATQATAGSQPKIVNAGALVVDSGIGGLDFDGDDFLTASSVSGLEGSISMFAVSVRDATGYVVSPSNSSAANRYFGIQEAASTVVANPRNTSNKTVSDSVSGNDRLTFVVTTGATSTSVGANGSAVTTTTDDYGDDFAGSNLDQIAIGVLRTVSASGQFNGRIREILVYSSDQTDNRTALETNINGHYSIF